MGSLNMVNRLKDIFYSENWKQNVLMLRYDAEIIVELDEEF